MLVHDVFKGVLHINPAQVAWAGRRRMPDGYDDCTVTMATGEEFTVRMDEYDRIVTILDGGLQ